jgi:hypothetical protein
MAAKTRTTTTTIERQLLVGVVANLRATSLKPRVSPGLLLEMRFR